MFILGKFIGHTVLKYFENEVIINENFKTTNTPYYGV